MAEVDKLAVSEGLQYTSCQCNEQMETTLDDEKTAPMTSAPHDATSAHMYDVDSSDPHSQLVDRAELSTAEVAHIGTLMKALSDLRLCDMPNKTVLPKTNRFSSLRRTAVNLCNQERSRRI